MAKENKDSESYKGFVALVRRMNTYRREALVVFANPSKAKRKRDIAEVLRLLIRSCKKPKPSEFWYNIARKANGE